MRNCTPSAPRQKVLIVPHPDGHLEAYADKSIDFCIARMPMAPTRASEVMADDVFYMSLPRVYRDLYRDDRLRAVGTTLPLLPKTMLAAKRTREAVVTLNHLAAEPQEVCVWTL